MLQSEENSNGRMKWKPDLLLVVIPFLTERISFRLMKLDVYRYEYYSDI